MVLFNLRKYQKIHLADWKSLLSTENNIRSLKATLSGYYAS